MTPQRWQQIDELLQQTLEREPAEQSVFLRDACGEDDDLRREVESLLAYHQRAAEKFETPPGELAADLLISKESREGQSIGHYQLIRKIGAGGMGEVYLARDTRLGRQVALKLLPRRFTSEPARIQRFQQEARAVSALNHPNILTIHEIGEAPADTGKVYFIATEFIEGQTLRDLIRNGGLTLSEALEVALQITNALSAAHAAGITHRDIKPENIMLRPDGYVKVLDFGLAKLTERRVESKEKLIAVSLSRRVAASPLTDPGMVLGTVSYMSPEQARGLETDARSDLFSLGIVLYEMLTSHRPFAGETPADVSAALIGATPPPLSDYAANVPDDLQQLINRLLEKDPARRFQSADELRQTIKQQKKNLLPADKFATREYSDLSLLAQRFNHGNTSSENKATVATQEMRQVTSSLSLFISHFIRSPLRVTAALVLLAGLIATVVFGRQWLYRHDASINTIAVLPFKPLMSGARDEVLEIGITDTLITRLSNLKGVTLRPIGAVRKYTALDQDSVAAGRELQVQAVLEGSLQKVGNQLRITTRLIRIPEGSTLWTRQFDEQWTDIFAVQDVISQRVADDLRGTITGEERSVLARNYTTNAEAYQLYLEGRYHWNKRSPDGMRKSVEAFKQAIARDPQYALAWVGLADAYATLGSYHVMPSREVLPLAREAAEQALKIDPQLAEAHATLGKIFTEYYWDTPRAEKEFRLALDLKPNYANAHHWYSTLLVAERRFDEAVREASRALILDDLSPAASTQVGSVLYRARRYDEAIAALQKTLEREPKHTPARFYKGLCLVMQERFNEGLAEFQIISSQSPESPDMIGMLGYIYGRMGKRDEALRYEKQLIELAKRRYVSPFSFVGIYAGLGNSDELFRWLEKGYEERDTYLRGINTDPLLDQIRNDPRFLSLQRRIGSGS